MDANWNKCVGGCLEISFFCVDDERVFDRDKIRMCITFYLLKFFFVIK